MNPISVKSSLGGYEILVGDAVLPMVGAAVARKAPKARVAMLAVDQAVADTWALEVAKSLDAAGLRVVSCAIKAGEENKSIAEVEKLWRCMADEHVQRSDVLLAVGGGIVGDMAAFAAATYMRGIATIMVPTTLLAMVDAAIGGKTAVNLHASGGGARSGESSGQLVKNLAGTFTAPLWVASDVRTLTTLAPREFHCGLAECVKHALLSDLVLLDWLDHHAVELAGSPRKADRAAADLARLAELVHRSASVKAAIVSRDEREAGERAHLNLGHTFAHAIESLLHNEIHHGEAVSIGLIAMAAASQAAGWWQDAGKFNLAGRLAKLGLPSRLPESAAAAAGPSTRPVTRDQLRAAMKLDKKGQSGGIRLVLLKGPGRPGVLDAASDAVIDAGLAAIGA